VVEERRGREAAGGGDGSEAPERAGGRVWGAYICINVREFPRSMALVCRGYHAVRGRLGGGPVVRAGDSALCCAF
jgi:hypothetical protein